MSTDSTENSLFIRDAAAFVTLVLSSLLLLLLAVSMFPTAEYGDRPFSVVTDAETGCEYLMTRPPMLIGASMTTRLDGTGRPKGCKGPELEAGQ